MPKTRESQARPRGEGAFFKKEFSFLSGLAMIERSAIATEGMRVVSYEAYRNDPRRFFEEALGIAPWSKQIEIAEAVRDYRRVVVAACNESGKTFAAAAIVEYFLQSRKGARVITTAPTDRQVRALLWSEIRAMHRRAKLPLGGHVAPEAPKLKIADKWDAVGFCTRGDMASSTSKFQGFHSETGDLLVVFDEAQGIQDVFWDAAEGMMGGEGCRFLAIGNPLERGTRFARAFENSAWKAIQISAFDTPNVAAQKVLIPGLVTLPAVEERRQIWGESDPRYVARVLGQFPATSNFSPFKPEWLSAAAQRWRKTEEIYPPGTNRGIAYVGLDVAYSEDGDNSCWAVIEGCGRALPPETLCGHDLMSVTGHTVRLVNRLLEWHEAVTLIVDEGGPGAGVVHRLRELRREGALRAEVQGVNFAEKSHADPGRYANAREEMWWLLVDALREGNLALPAGAYDEDLGGVRADRVDSKGRSRWEDKDETRTRMGRSPDRGDALALAHRGWRAARIRATPTRPESYRAPSWH